jgi:hypothetical protein
VPEYSDHHLVVHRPGAITVTVTDVPESRTQQKRVTLHEPDFGWSAEAYYRQLEAYVAEFGRAPQTVTMHPETATALGLHENVTDGAGASDAPFLVTSSDYARQEITLYY